LLNVLSIFSGLLILFSLVFYWIFAFTPVQNLLPKELPSSARSEILELHEQLDELKNQVEIRNSKAEVLNNLLSGKESLYDSTSQRQNPANN
jgi:predicted component of type VI protein secretion system